MRVVSAKTCTPLRRWSWNMKMPRWEHCCPAPHPKMFRQLNQLWGTQSVWHVCCVVQFAPENWIPPRPEPQQESTAKKQASPFKTGAASIEATEKENPPSVLSRVNPDETGTHPPAGFQTSEDQVNRSHVDCRICCFRLLYTLFFNAGIGGKSAAGIGFKNQMLT